ncbi:hypothetical protein A5856_002316, partial [Enterococcus faecium]
ELSICYLLQYCSFVFLMNRNCRSSFDHENHWGMRKAMYGSIKKERVGCYQ